MRVCAPRSLAPRRLSRMWGLTLIEMLVAMAITLLMMAAVVTLFANISTGVRDRRAVIELSGQLRQAQQRLMRDLQGATCRGKTWQKPEENQGYIEIVEGRWSDAEPSALLDDPDDNGKDVYGDDVRDNGELDYATSNVPGSQQTLNGGAITDGLALGDYDDILALTVRSMGEPFVGRGPGGQRIESHEAEVIWYAIENPSDGSLGEPGMRRVYRRVLLVAPWLKSRYLDRSSNSGSFNFDFHVDSRAPAHFFFREYDISSRVDPETGMWTPNTLGDLTKRENRFGHLADVWTRDLNGRLALNPNNFPNRLDVSAIRLDPQLLTTGLVNRFPTGSTSLLHPFGLPFEFDAADSFVRNDPSSMPQLPPLALRSLASGSGKVILDRTGEDLMLDNALAFDVRVFDPEAPLFAVDTSSVGAVLQPGDIGLRNRANGSFQLPPNSLVQPVGYGAFVDLSWNVLPTRESYASNPATGVAPAYQDLQTPSASVLGGRPAARSGLDLVGPQDVVSGNPNRIPYRSAVYDTWSLHYEDDGIDSDRDGLVDQGANGLDDNNRFGVDDSTERETSPPYDVPLSGIQVRLRVYETDARQVRETSATHSFQ